MAVFQTTEYQRWGSTVSPGVLELANYTSQPFLSLLDSGFLLVRRSPLDWVKGFR